MTGSGYKRAVADLAQIHRASLPPRSHFASTAGRDTSRCSEATGVGSDPVKPLPDVGSARARSTQRGRPDGVACCLHVRANAVEPCPAIRSVNLFAKDNARRSLADEAGEIGPEVAGVVGAEPLTGSAERLTGAATGPDRPIVGPACESERETPSPDSREEVALNVGNKVICSNIGDTPRVHVSGCNQAARDQASKPSGGEGVDFVIVGGQGDTLTSPRSSSCSTC